MRKLLRSPVIKVVARWANRQPPIWDGVYKKFDQAPVVGQGFASEAWLSDMERYTRTAVTALGNNGAGMPENVPQYHALLAMLVASLPAVERSVRVIDFGGGMGVGFANLMRCVPAKTALDYLIIDNEESCRRGRELLIDFPSVKFASELPHEIESVYVMVLSGVLQFVEHYEELLTQLASFRPTFWLFTFLPAGEVPTFVSAQCNVPGSILPVWFLNLKDLIAKFETLGYRLTFKCTLDRVFDMSNFPSTHQLQRQCNLLFRRQ